MTNKDNTLDASAKIPDNCYLESETRYLSDGTPFQVLHAKPYLQANIASVKRLGGMTEVSVKSIKLLKGTDTHKIHAFNLASGYLQPDEETIEKRAAESKRVSESRLRNQVRELGACNEWDYFITITLNPAKWDRMNPKLLQSAINNDFRRWARKQINNTRPYKKCAYLIIPECHQNGAIHLHGLVHLIPEAELLPYTMTEINSDIPLPYRICEAVRNKIEIYHCKIWDEKYGYNTLTRIRDRDRISNYLTKYITKELNATIFKTRCWHSRGLNKAELMARYQIPAGEPALEDYIEFIRPVSAITQSYYLPGEQDNGKIAGVKSLIDGDVMTADDVSYHLNTAYLKID